MTEQLQRFKELYTSLVLEQELPMNEEMLQLFDVLLQEQFDDNPELMSAFIQSIIDEQTPPEPSELELLQQENAELKQRQLMAEDALLALSDMLLNR